MQTYIITFSTKYDAYYWDGFDFSQSSDATIFESRSEAEFEFESAKIAITDWKTDGILTLVEYANNEEDTNTEIDSFYHKYDWLA